MSSDVAAPTAITVNGHRALLGPLRNDAGGYEARWTARGFGVVVRGAAPTMTKFVSVVQTMHEVSVNTLLAALPTSIVTPSGRRDAITGMLADIPRPPGFDRSRLDDAPLLMDRYQLGARVVLTVTCGWLHRWLAGEPAQRPRAAAALASAHHWAILTEMRRTGALPGAIFEGVDIVNGAPTGKLYPGFAKTDLLKNRLRG